jgi:5-methylcytosine-specific restriction endonuclease McrA
MVHTCSVCGEKIEGGVTAFIDHTEAHIISRIKETHPDWVEDDGLCARCLDYFRKQLKGEA